MFFILILLVAMDSWQVVKSPPHELAWCFDEAQSLLHPSCLPSYAEQQAQANAVVSLPDSSEDRSTVRPVVEKYFGVLARIDVTNFGDDSSFTD